VASLALVTRCLLRCAVSSTGVLRRSLRKTWRSCCLNWAAWPASWVVRGWRQTLCSGRPCDHVHDLVVVGHSLAGLTIPLVAQSRLVGGVYLSPDGAVHWHPEAAAASFFADCQPDVAVAAAARLRGQFWTITQEVTPLQRWPSVPSSYVLGSADPIVNPAWSRRVVPRVLGVQPIEVAAGHSPFLSAPVALADALQR